MKKVLNIFWVVAFCCFVESFASLDVNMDNQIGLIEKMTRLQEILVENTTTKESGYCESDSECLPGGRCNGKGENGTVCRCFRGVSGDKCETFEECVKNPQKCGDGNDVVCDYDPNNKITYCNCKDEGRRFDVKLKKCVEQKPCADYKECKNAGQCEGETIKYCECEPGTYGDYCENIEECENNPNLCGSGTDVICSYNYRLKRAFCHCLNGTYRFDVPQKKCVERKACNSQEECRPLGACTKTCQSFELCNDHDYFEGLESCHCAEGTSGERCEIVDDCYNKVVDCGTGDNVECKYNYIRGVTAFAYCTCTKSNLKYDKASKLCRDCDCGPMASGCSIKNGNKVCSCNSQSYNTGDKCEDCKCGAESTGCTFKDGKKSCICKEGFFENNGICERCDCGDNSTGCKFENGLKVCSCKPGFAVGNYGVCTPTCSHTRQCENGGLCLQNICMCPAGTTGPFCERIYECENKLCGENNDVYCEYNTETEKAYCKCQNIDAIYDSFDKTCKMCSCDLYGTARYKISWESCEFVKGRKVCHCKKGYSYEPKLDICYQCSCGTNSTCEFDVNGNKICHCDEGFIELQRSCIECDCGPNGKCVSNGKSLRCDCELGFSEDSRKCKFCYCGPDSKCTYKNKKKVCECPKGYEDVKGYCKEINECLKAESCSEPGMICIKTPGSFRCECKPGYLYRHPDKNNSTSWCEKPEETQPDYSPWKIGYGVMSAGFLLIFIGLVVIIFKIRRNSTDNVRQADIALGRTQNHY